ncbi:cobalt transporter [Geoalkalibacter halelectricus]|uniref:Cobalt transporter n=1 Tax=Geoalkalibacter halelectricus TaxID=2847045 RepID=A0ABY5ZNS8_9BACT|nr:cobalt transporter [Geoalkalibacter halelectricus]MDO3377523.1 cobalt transporter [Geoalkalibacter halelectricus]UWZ80718.1 cobalt transporter [Geoalkalibacter halelectricus]
MKKILAALIFFSAVLISTPATAEEEEPRWAGVDETVVEKFARDLGREPRDPLFDTDQGDLLLFFFTLAGATGGFIMGYYWHKVFVAGKQEQPPRT